MSCLILVLQAAPAAADSIRVAVASNFQHAAKALARRFQAETGHEVILAFGSTGRHYAQIRHGAPFEAFLAADRDRPQRLEREGIALPASRFTYAVGRLVLWSPDPELVDAAGNVLRGGEFRHVALANPKLAPYGKAAEQVLKALGAWEGLQGRMVRGENIGQTYQFVHSGNAALGFVAWSQLRMHGRPVGGSLWMPPQASYDPIQQQAVLLEEHPVARQFLRFTRGAEAREIIRSHGYTLP